ncbi:glycosyltransferase family 4 protein [Cupriavidus metallidurans]|uniref:glycosyltransferase family 4 protein n=1 Tax=Cupriavidus metallidurans TaxID=119219 RepID=UPI003D7170CC
MSKRPTLCFLTGTLNAFAGAERMTAVIANALAERGYRVFVLSLWDHASVFPLHDAVEHHTLFEERPSFKRAYFSTVLGIRRFVRDHRIDVIIEVDTMLTLFTLPATFGMKVRRIAWEHCHFDEDLGEPARRVARRLAARTCKAVVVLTERDRQRWLGALGQQCQVKVISNPLPFPFPGVPAQRGSRVVLAVGRLVHAKGFDQLLEAWALIAAYHPEWRLVIVGEGEERNGLEARRLALGLDQSVSLPGAGAHIATYYQNADIFCLSSRYEGFGLVLLEAMAFGLPVVSTDCETGPKEIIRDGLNGLLVATGNPQALANALSRLIEDEHLSNHLAIQGRMDAYSHDVNAVCQLWRSLLNAII